MTGTKDKILALLSERLPESAPRSLLESLAEEIEEIVAQGTEWEELTPEIEPELGYHLSVQCADICPLAAMARDGALFRIFRKRCPVATDPEIPQMAIGSGSPRPRTPTACGISGTARSSHRQHHAQRPDRR